MPKRIPDICDCPGAWYGNTPGRPLTGCGYPIPNDHGHVIVDPKFLRAAFDWLRRRYWILDTSLTTDQGVCIGLQLKRKGMPMT